MLLLKVHEYILKRNTNGFIHRLTVRVFSNFLKSLKAFS